MNPKVDFYFVKADRWQDELKCLRAIALESGLIEELKWGCPCYTLDKNNVVLIHTFKDYCAFLFFKGVLMKDPKNLLIQQTANVQAARQIRFTSVAQIKKLNRSLKAYIRQAAEIEKAGLKVKLKKTSEFAIPDEFQNRMREIPELKKAFKALTPGRQKAYLFYFSQAKQAKTREARVEKYVRKILSGKGMED